MSPVTAALTETVDPDAVAIPATTPITVTLAEWGNAVQVTRKLRLFALSDVDPAIADLVAYNMVDSLDRQIMAIAAAGTNVIRENAGKMLINAGTTAAVVSTDTFKSRDARAVVAGMRTRSALPRDAELYVGYIHPDAPSEQGHRASARELRLAFGVGSGRVASASRIQCSKEHLEWCHRSESSGSVLLEGTSAARMKVACGLRLHVRLSLSMVAVPVRRQLSTARSCLLVRHWQKRWQKSPESGSAPRSTA